MAEIPKEQIRAELNRMLDERHDDVRIAMKKADAEFRAAPVSQQEDILQEWTTKMANQEAEMEDILLQFHRFIDNA